MFDMCRCQTHVKLSTEKGRHLHSDIAMIEFTTRRMGNPTEKACGRVIDTVTLYELFEPFDRRKMQRHDSKNVGQLAWGNRTDVDAVHVRWASS